MSEDIIKYDGDNAVSTGRGAGVEIAASREMAEVQAAVVMARRFPRDEMRAIEKIRNACSRPTLAESAVYQYSRGGVTLAAVDPAAEALAANWAISSSESARSSKPTASHLRGVRVDVESNARREKLQGVAHQAHEEGDVLLQIPATSTRWSRTGRAPRPCLHPRHHPRRRGRGRRQAVRDDAQREGDTTRKGSESCGRLRSTASR